MIARVQMFAVARQLSGHDVMELQVPDQAAVRDLRAALLTAVPQLEPLMPHLLFAINAEYANDNTALPPGAEIACIPPVSGG